MPSMNRWVEENISDADKLAMLERAFQHFSDYCCGWALEDGDITLEEAVDRLETYKQIAEDYRKKVDK